MTDPTEDVPPDGPPGQRARDSQFRALGLGMPRAAGLGAVVELADQLDRTLQGMDAAVPVVADIHPAATGRALPVQDIEFPESEVRILRPRVRHPPNLRGVVRSIEVAARKEL